MIGHAGVLIRGQHPCEVSANTLITVFLVDSIRHFLVNSDLDLGRSLLNLSDQGSVGAGYFELNFFIVRMEGQVIVENGGLFEVLGLLGSVT